MAQETVTTTEVAHDALREMYQEADPPLDFDDVVENPDAYDDEWYENHHLNAERQKEIVDKHLSQHDLTDSGETFVIMTAITDLGPTSAPCH